MRTTLKRGIGRGAELNGNGRTVLPPGVLTPVTLYRQPPPPKRSLAVQVGRFFLWLFVTLLMLVCGLVGGFYLWAHESAAALQAHSPDAKRAQARLDEVPDAKHAAIALVVGYDHRAGEKGLPSRSDTMMLIRADPVTNTISLLSFPRDLLVPIYCPGRGGGEAVAQATARINSAYAFCGSSGALETVRHLTGLPINYLISVNFLGFIAVVNKLGGVWMDVDRRYYNKNVGTANTNFANIDLQPGYQRLTGKQALDFVRYRHTDSDVYRLARQQAFVTAARQRIAKSIGPRSLVSIVNTIAHHGYVEIGVGGGGEVDLGTIYSYAKFAYGLPPGHVFRVNINGLVGYNELTTDQSNIEGAVQSFLNPDVEASTTATEVALGRKLRKNRTLPPAKVTLTVLNGNGQPGSASTGSYLLHQKGYTTLLPPGNQPANAPNWNYFHSKVYYDPDRPNVGKPAAQQVARLIGSADVEAMPRNIAPLSNKALLAVVVGSTFHGQLAPVVIRTPPTRQPPKVRRDPAETRATVLKYRKRLPFRLEYPTRLERSSYLDSGYGETPARVYPLEGRPTVRLTFRTGANEYWGIQETNWADAPALGDKSLTQQIGRRTFDLYYSGSHLHMVVLRDNGATYWVVNTLLDSLSNETMLAFARGLRPLPR